MGHVHGQVGGSVLKPAKIAGSDDAGMVKGRESSRLLVEPHDVLFGMLRVGDNDAKARLSRRAFLFLLFAVSKTPAKAGVQILRALDT